MSRQEELDENGFAPEHLSCKLTGATAASVRSFRFEMQMPKRTLIRLALKEYLEKRGFYFD